MERKTYFAGPDPPHPGEAIRELCIKPSGITVTDAAKALGVSRKTLNNPLDNELADEAVFLTFRRARQYIPFRKSQGVAIWSGTETTSLCF